MLKHRTFWDHKKGVSGIKYFYLVHLFVYLTIHNVLVYVKIITKLVMRSSFVYPQLWLIVIPTRVSMEERVLQRSEYSYILCYY